MLIILHCINFIYLKSINFQSIPIIPLHYFSKEKYQMSSTPSSSSVTSLSSNVTTIKSEDLSILNNVTIFNEIDKFLSEETDYIANMSNCASILWHAFHEARGMNAINWCGFYIVRKTSNKGKKLEEPVLVLGPFMGKPACRRIPFDKGVCGACARTESVQLVSDVHHFEGHIACDEASQSEIVIPVFYDDELVAVLDIDCPRVGGFNDNDRIILERVVERLGQGSIWPNLAENPTGL